MTVTTINTGLKYELKKEKPVFRGRGGCIMVQQYRVVALKDFTTVCGTEIKVGDMGGIVCNPNNLSQGGNSWIFPDSRVNENGRVEGNAVLKEGSSIGTNAVAKGNAILTHSFMTDDTEVSGDAQVFNTWMSGNSCIKKRAWVDGADLSDNSTISGTAVVKGPVYLKDNSGVYKNGRIDATKGRIYIYDKVMIGEKAKVTVVGEGEEINLHGNHLYFWENITKQPTIISTEIASLVITDKVRGSYKTATHDYTIEQHFSVENKEAVDRFEQGLLKLIQELKDAEKE